MHDHLHLAIFWILLTGTLLLAIAMQWSERNLQVTDPAFQKNFIVRIQFAKNLSLLKEMFKSVGNKSALGYNLGIDYAYMIFFYGFIAYFSFLLTSNHHSHLLYSVGKTGSLLMIIPFLADCFENYCLARWSFNPQWNGPFGLYYLMVRIKWAVAAIVGLFCLVILFYNLIVIHKVFP